MTFWKKTLRIIGIVVLILIALSHMVERTLILRSFSQLERQHTQQDVERALNAIAQETHNLDILANDWAAWDDTYQFVVDQNEGYKQANLLDQTFIDAGLNLILIADSAGQIVFVEGFDLARAEEIAIAEFSPDHLYPGDPLLVHADTASSKSGVILLSGGPMLVAARPILSSDNQGPSRGTLIMGRFLDQARIQSLSETVQLSLQFQRINVPALPADFRQVQAALAPAAPAVVRALSETSVAGYALISDIEGQPALILRVDLPRDMYAQGQASLRYQSLLIAVAGLLFFVATVLLLEMHVLAPMNELGRQVKKISLAGDLSARLSCSGKSEISELADGINRSLADLQCAQAGIRQRERRLEGLAKATQALLAPCPDIPYGPFLEALGQASQANRVYVFLNHRGPDGELLTSLKAEWHAEGATPQINNPALQNLPIVARGFGRWVEMLSRGEPICGAVSEFPPTERSFLESLDMKALLILPLILDSAWVGFIGFTQRDETHRWETSEMDLLLSLIHI